MGDKPILIVDDEEDLCRLVEEYLNRQGYHVSAAHTGDDMRRLVMQSPPSIVLLDLVLPDADGLALARWLRERCPDIGILMLTGRGEAIDRIIGLEMGADDYLGKPFHLRELLARINSIGRRIGPPAAPAPRVNAPSRLHFAGWLLDMATRQLFAPDHANVRLTGGEFDLLAAFVMHPNEVLSRDRLLDLTHDRRSAAFDRAIDVRVGRLRRKLTAPSGPQLIRTVRGAGYLFTASIDRAPSASAT